MKQKHCATTIVSLWVLNGANNLMEQLALNYSPKNRLNLISYKINNTKKRQEKRKRKETQKNTIK